MKKQRLKTTGEVKRQRSAKRPDGMASLPWHVLTPEEQRRPGAALLALLLEAAYVNGLSMRDLAREIGLSYPYFAGIRNGGNDIRKLGDKHFDRIAALLNLPKVAVLLAAGKLTLADFCQNPTFLRTDLVPALEFIQRDPEIGPYFPPSVFSADPSIQQLLVLLYEKATGRLLIRSKSSIDEIRERHRLLTDGIEKR